MNGSFSFFQGRPVLFCVFAAMSLILASCDSSPIDESSHPLFIKAMNLKEKQEFEKSANLLEEMLRARPEFQKARLELASIYDDNLNDPVCAIYHYRMFLRIFPDSPDAENISKWCSAAEKDFAAVLGIPLDGNAPVQLKTEIAALKERDRDSQSRILKLEKENAYLKKKLNLSLGWSEQRDGDSSVTVEPASATEERRAPEAPQAAIKTAAGSYTVRSYDTLMRISKEVYGDPKHYRQIFDANRDVLSSETGLVPGQVLKIPKLKKE